MLASKYRNIDPRMIYDLASGVEEPDEVARRYGFEGDEWDKLAERPELIRAVKQQAAEQAKNGTTLKNKARLLSDSMLNNLYMASMRDDVPVKDKASALLAITKLAGLDTPSAGQAQGAGFSITINLPSSPATPPAVEVVPKETEALENKDVHDEE
ncbi:hypothetical protein [Paratractidigestivibacter sp.]|uniref:hypothetical protein n=1 Tax=Paratractidigestivibacter sp. TaxID=2847316 RepID=UPI002AC8BBAD|nr:hypothetical protein [Paratractidigestivibacter sp.]